MKLLFTMLVLLLVFALCISSFSRNRVPTQEETPTLMGALRIFEDYKAVSLEKFLDSVSDALLLADEFFARADKSIEFLGFSGIQVALLEIFWNTYNEFYPENKEAFGTIAGAVGSFVLALFYTIAEVFVIIFDLGRALFALIRVLPPFIYDTWIHLLRLVNYFFGYTLDIPAEQVSPSATEGARGNLLPPNLSFRSA